MMPDSDRLADVLARASRDMRTISLALAAAGQHAAAIQVMGFQAIIAHEVSEKLVAAEMALTRRKRAG